VHEDDSHLDGCAINMAQPDQISGDGDLNALVMFADCWDDPAAVEERRVALIEWDTAVRAQEMADDA
jgi:hypothetical protein